MKRARSKNPVLLLALAVSICLNLQAQDGGSSADRLPALRAQFEELRQDAFSEQQKFDTRYLGELEKLKESAKAAANLDLILAIQDEAKVFPTRPLASAAPSSHDELARLQKIYDDQTARIKARRDGTLSSLISGYQKQLEDLRVELTQGGDIEGAVAAQAEIKRIESVIPDVAPAPEPPAPAGGVVNGRYVRVSIEGGGKVVSLTEVQIFKGRKNIAPEGVASQSSDNEQGGSAELAIDKNTDGNFYVAKSTTHTAKTTDPWWEVDLGEEEEISRVVIWNRTDGELQHRLDGFKLSILTEGRETVWEQTFPTAPERDLSIEIEPR